MAITFIQKRKRQKYLILVFIAIILITITIILKEFILDPGIKEPLPLERMGQEIIPAEAEQVMDLSEIKIDFEILESLILRKFIPFKEIPLFEQEKGRENPFLPY